MKKKLQGKKKWLTGILSALLILMALISASYHLAYWGRIYPGVAIAGQPVGNLTPAQAISTINHQPSTINHSKITLFHDDQTWEIDLNELNFSYQATATAQKAFQIGRSGNFLRDLATKIKIWSQGINLGMEYSLDQNLLEIKVATIASQVFIPTIEPSIKIVSQEIQIESGKEGQELNRRKLLSLLNLKFSFLNFSPLKLPIIQISPSLTPGQIEKTQKRAKKFLGKKLILVEADKKWQLGEEELIQLLSFTDGFDREKIASWSANLAAVINRSPENAAFQFSQGRVIEFRPAKEGKLLEEEKTTDLIIKNLTELEVSPTGKQEKKKEITIKLPVRTRPAAIKTADVNSLGIKELIGRGVSYFRGSMASRIDNIRLASSRLNGLLIPPGEVFSFNQSLGEVSRATGFKEAYIIKEGRTILGDGGGVCQVSTTLFRAALNAGLPIVERHPHAYRVSYYEQNSQPGFDATVFEPTVDLKFKNDTPAHILIQTKVDSKNKILIFELYGTDDSRVVTLSKSRIWDQTPPPPDLYQNDPTLPAGVVKQIDWKAWGAKVAFDYKVIRGDEVLQERTFYSAYRPWQAVYLRGSGGQ